LLDALVTTINDGDAVFNTASRPTLTHSDLGWWNVLLRQEHGRWRIVAILDWEWALTADAVWEFADLWSNPADPYPLPASFMSGYRERCELPFDMRVRQRLYRLLHHLEMMLVCHAHFGREHLRYHLAAIEQLFKMDK
jgi:Ser/Thr protein kinase RdoA (MazF antagonist)